MVSLYTYFFFFSSRLLFCSCISSERLDGRDYQWRECVSQFHHNVATTSVRYASKVLFSLVFVDIVFCRLRCFSGIIIVSSPYSYRILSALSGPSLLC